jgi:hypothetical protein
MERMEVDGMIINFQRNINKLKDMSVNKANDKNDKKTTELCQY